MIPGPASPPPRAICDNIQEPFGYATLVTVVVLVRW